jgi:hypothetical protein
MKPAEPTLDQWRDLYDAAAAFRDLAPWRWMSDGELFAVRHPETGETLYCCVLGTLGEVLGMLVYPGANGYRFYRRMQREEVQPTDPDVLLYLHTLNVEFHDRAALDARDRKVLKELGLSFHGPRAWPLFRSYRPLLYPWYLSEQEASCLTVALRQALDVCRRAEKNRKLFEAPDGKSILTRVESGADWSDVWTAPPSETEEPPRLPPVPEKDLELLRKAPGVRSATWEADFTAAPAWIRPGPVVRPYRPVLCILADHDTGKVLAADLEEPDDPPRVFRDRFLKWVNLKSPRPRALRVRKPAAFAALEPVAAALGIEIRLQPRLRAIEPALASLRQHMSRPS